MCGGKKPTKETKQKERKKRERERPNAPPLCTGNQPTNSYRLLDVKPLGPLHQKNINANLTTAIATPNPTAHPKFTSATDAAALTDTIDGVGLPVAGGVAAAPVTDPVGQYPVDVPAPAPAPVPGTASTKNGTVSVTRSAPSAPHPAHEATVVVIGTLTAAGCIPSPPQYLLQPGTRIVVQCSAGVRRAASVAQTVVYVTVVMSVEVDGVWSSGSPRGGALGGTSSVRRA